MKMGKVIVYHGSYDCDTGCCGHIIELGNDGDTPDEFWGFENPVKDDFVFTHPYGLKTEEELKKWAKELVEDRFGKEHCEDLDWEHCRVTDDC
jgi:hypothetical protein